MNLRRGTLLTCLITTLALALTACGADDTDSAQAGTSAKFGFSGWSVGYLPTAIAIDRLKEQGFTVEAVELGGNANQLQAAAQGQVDISAIAQVMDAIDEGVPLRFFLGGNSNEFVMAAQARYGSCASLAGRNVGIQSESSFVGQLAIQWVKKDCPGTEPTYTVVEGSENRLAAMLQGQMDASPIDLQDWTLLSRERPGDFTMVADLTQSFPIMRAAFAARPEFLTSHKDLATAWVSTHLDVYRDIYQNPNLLVEKGRELLPEIDADALPAIVDAFVTAKVWPVDGGLQPESVQATIDFFNADGKPYQKVTAPGDVTDRSILDAVLAERG
ncbi:hypothetical protein AWW66_22175 [Micromonospora rosaria]|uniref:SsuA/THI5-like domain-containing protein n=1 Tax=Micromonospora rosaria TaxID=47874 RepID=A0A136PNF2_9ACTN|nr:ABC transporter substrate-binding protein [Micromonospora rosaria]KXK59836.1 hypothetical protein AWW66_22175 [Micromonospora rosaria]